MLDCSQYAVFGASATSSHDAVPWIVTVGSTTTGPPASASRTQASPVSTLKSQPDPDALMLIGSALPAPAPAARANATGAGIVNHVAPRSSTSAIDPSGCSRRWSPVDPESR